MPAAVVKLVLKPSRLLAGFLLVIHLLALVANFLLYWPWWAQLGFFGLLLFSVIACWRWWQWLSSCQMIRYGSKGWRLDTNSGRHVLQLKRATVWSWCVFLSFTDIATGKTLKLPLLIDCTDNLGSLRQLRVLLRHQSVYKAGT